MIKTVNLEAGYGKLQVLFDVNFEAFPGEITAVLGPNGSGKSTLLKAIFGIARVYNGRIYIGDRDVTKLPTHERARLGVAYVSQLRNVFSTLTVLENLRMAAYQMSSVEFEERLREVSDIVPLREILNRRAGELSGGWRQLVAIAMALVRRATIFMLDEPTAQLAPKMANQVLDVVLKLREAGYTVVLVEQNAKKALEVSDKAYLLVSGRVHWVGPADKLLEEKELGRLYLGFIK
ncbi:amino acid/amide ABC transporter ATP-binding protein 2, HAAT family [Pyrobaculum islandicum DSM 4184]|uniref:Amino acid/amide ABC transporter ATP-binding protein 2, HAAT family n=1 Tax=Pyrobaculum islandicum (strain DSM 4184 / JCM 9189 / GEO3) TaxID=384616 RepID=A1RRB0_PYRIL|nr:ABC transporter ATP-binding protein [Pyrobaculum islandicum]ABL87492.1 amino acid/amide ABC transporter ATP-binding protein 2, HAAT family [Pyrobaculum islandicum DSM 4184]